MRPLMLAAPPAYWRTLDAAVPAAAREASPPAHVPSLPRNVNYLNAGYRIILPPQVLSLLTPLLEGYRHLCMYRCRQGLQSLQSLPHEQYHTGWVLCAVGRAFFELVDYQQAAAAFREARNFDPHRLEVRRGAALVAVLHD